MSDDRVVRSLLDSEGPFETVTVLAGLLDAEAQFSTVAKLTKERFEFAAQMRSPASVRMALNDALLKGVGTDVWRGWCQDVLAWMKEPLHGDTVEVATRPSS